MAKIYDLKPLVFAAVSGIQNAGTVVPVNFRRAFYEIVLDNIHSGYNTVVFYDTYESAERLRLRLDEGQKWTKNTEHLDDGVPVFAPLQEAAYLGVATQGPMNISMQYADEEGKGVQP